MPLPAYPLSLAESRFSFLDSSWSETGRPLRSDWQSGIRLMRRLSAWGPKRGNEPSTRRSASPTVAQTKRLVNSRDLCEWTSRFTGCAGVADRCTASNWLGCHIASNSTGGPAYGPLQSPRMSSSHPLCDIEQVASRKEHSSSLRTFAGPVLRRERPISPVPMWIGIFVRLL
ncbi:uncharacterized protein CC84DRAFT_1175218 [Paraphaeosphaeria sporulosa]|uniref:Uncharacterized protein n=1 Tax=Paraphaeosphaeria sporulosa TaxID=1460663 RepID=A0A177CKM8_9PLEO|nr:uncharacterized protein CC84DRAFT_1175218 [Paraphaeosphaeria sporulosa]OAG07400.1 hypothetical protein CC84DRAFT_1175218 [Paraphaeosphaeria sporulosa]